MHYVFGLLATEINCLWTFSFRETRGQFKCNAYVKTALLTQPRVMGLQLSVVHVALHCFVHMHGA